MANVPSTGNSSSRYANITTDFLEFYRDSANTLDTDFPNHGAFVHNRAATETEEQLKSFSSGDLLEMNQKTRPESPNIMLSTPSRDRASSPSSTFSYSPTLHRAPRTVPYSRPLSHISISRRDLNDGFAPSDRQTLDEPVDSPSRFPSIRRAGAVSVTPRRYSPLPEKKRHSLTFGAIDSSILGATTLSRETVTRSASTSQRTRCIESRRRSEVWEEIEAIKERISKLKEDSPLNAKVGLSAGMTALSPSEPKQHSSSEQFEYLADELDAKEDTEVTDKDEMVPSDESVTSLVRRMPTNATTTRRSTPTGDWEQKEPVTALMSSPSPSPSSSKTVSSQSRETIYSQQGSVSPLPSRQTPAEKHLIESLERAKRLHDRNVSMVMLERVVSDTISLYNSVEAGPTDTIDRLCLSLANFITHTTDTSSLANAHTPSPISQSRNSVHPHGSSIARHRISPITRSSTTPTVSAFYDPMSPSLGRSSTVRSDLDVNSPKFRSPSGLSGQRLRHSRPFELPDKRNYF